MVALREFAFGFEDSELVGYARQDGSLVVDLRLWNTRVAQLRFSDVIDFHDMLAGDFSDIEEDASAEHPALLDALHRAYDVVPAEHPYRVFVFRNHDDAPSLLVVAAACDAVLGDSTPES